MNELLVFICDGAPVRGEIVSIGSAWQAVLERRNDPPAVRKILGDFVGAATLLSASLKFDGTLIIQAQSKGPIQLLVVECKSDLSMRATVKLSVDPSEIDDRATLGELLDASNSGRLVITLDPADREPGQAPYQGIVALQEYFGDELRPVKNAAEAIVLYMQNSEQLDTRIWLSSDDKSVGGLLLQRLPDSGGHAHLDPQAAAESGAPRCHRHRQTPSSAHLRCVPLWHGGGLGPDGPGLHDHEGVEANAAGWAAACSQDA